ncbi:MAG: hypothetical protein A3F95_00055 [Candidatus Nealsonbacteria bacterium RIFCSPLOWO2_12_FULL_39_31]|uniref:Uncharacterized protein n=1 Tax=Candidatus Nealsonbacteria bacterium RIFCSPLOWO2_12_FULL_39_31 TaxID=1801676 RepID=A0A1G2EPH7_9BACT|nr:MAG: hypothetical protein A3F95_00055 [Candidatus Nealsonbacteria bacterium RIFCSPLOWO2_12_FULL_39_31]
MKNFTEEQIAQMYDNLPEDLKDSIFGLEMNEIVEKIGRENQLNIEQIGDLANETGMVMLGVTHPNEFIGNLADRLEVDKEKARAIAGEINEQVFKKVRDSLRKIHNMREGGEEEQKTEIEHHQGPSLMVGQNREDILKEIEKDHSQENLIPDIMKGNANPFEEKMKEGVLIAPVEEKHYIEESAKTALLPEPEKPKKYQGFDPYREQLE